MLKVALTTTTLLIGLSACQLIQNAATDSAFTTPSASGQISGRLSGPPVGREIDSSGDGFAYTAGAVDGEGLLAKAGLVAGTDVSAPPLTGGATYSGRYELVRFGGIFLSGDSISGFRSTDAGNITLTANFDAATLTGSDDELSVDGRLNGETLTGNVTYQGVRGSLRGLVGSDKAVGTFHGNNADKIFAGGFLANSNPN